VESNPAPTADPNDRKSPPQQYRHENRILTFCGYAFVMVSVFCFGVIAYSKLQQSIGVRTVPHFAAWLDLVQQEAETISLLFIAVVAAMLGKGMLMSVQASTTATIPYEDYELIKKAVMDGKPEPIDQYVRLRSLSGMSGNFTKLGVTGLPLTTVFLTLVFSLISLLPVNDDASTAFLDLAKLTLGAFIGSFVQGRVEQRRSLDSEGPNPTRRSDLIA
jgi:hypothetical protein